MSEAIINRLIAIIENGTYANASLGAKALRTFPENLDALAKPVVLILPRGNSGWSKEGGAGLYATIESYELRFFIKEALIDNEAIGIVDAANLESRTTQIFLSRPQLQYNGTQLDGVYAEISLQTTSSLSTPIPYPISGFSANQGAKFYWGYVMTLQVPFRQFITLSYQG